MKYTNKDHARRVLKALEGYEITPLHRKMRIAAENYLATGHAGIEPLSPEQSHANGVTAFAAELNAGINNYTTPLQAASRIRSSLRAKQTRYGLLSDYDKGRLYAAEQFLSPKTE